MSDGDPLRPFAGMATGLHNHVPDVPYTNPDGWWESDE